MATRRKSPMDHPAVVTFLILAVVAAMSLAAEVLKPLALAVLLSFALAPLAGFFERRRVPRAIAVLLTVVLALGALSGIGYVVVRQLSMLAYRLPSYQERIQKKVDFLKPSDDTAFYRRRRSPATWPSRSTRRSSRGTRRWTCGSSSSRRSGSGSRRPSAPTWSSSASAASC